MAKSRKSTFALIFLLAALGAYAAWWGLLAHELRRGLTRWSAERQAAGWQVATGETTLSGFPGRPRLGLAAPSLTDPAGDLWNLPPTSLSLAPLAPWRLRLEAAGVHTLTLSGQPPLALTAAEASAELVLGEDRLSLSLGGVELGGARLEGLTASLHRLGGSDLRFDQPSLALTAALHGLTLPAATKLPLGQTIAEAQLSARLMGGLDAGGGKPAIIAWRDAGGTIEVDALSLTWPPLRLGAKGTLALDQDLQPQFAASATLSGGAETIAILAKAGSLTPRDAALASLALGLVSKPEPDGVVQSTLPITLQDRRLSVGPVKLATLPLLKW
jgi:hypothetical protein